MIQLATPTRATLEERFAAVRSTSDRIAAPLSAEDCTVQSMPDASPIKWHLAHTSWFFETFVLEALDGFEPHDPAFRMLFNSYYNGVGEQHSRPERGLVTRPGMEAVRAYRAAVDRGVSALLSGGACDATQQKVIELGLNHEQQHQELMLMDLKHLLSRNPLQPAYREEAPTAVSDSGALRWLEHEGGEAEVGIVDTERFHFDNEGPRHRVQLIPFALASRTVTNGEYLEFIEAGGYDDPMLWLADGWALARAEGWQAPLYWRRDGEAWSTFTLHGRRALDLHAPVIHVSYYEAAAYAQWRGMRLPTEAEWETVAVHHASDGDFFDDGVLEPRPAAGATQFHGSVWEFTQSPYVAYPGFRAAAGALGEYNGKFMCNQMVLRGGCCLSSRNHLRPSYRNFFYPSMRWQVGGIRLARDL